MNLRTEKLVPESLFASEQNSGSSVPFLDFCNSVRRITGLLEHAFHHFLAFNALLRHGLILLFLIQVTKPVLATYFQFFLNLGQTVGAGIILDQLWFVKSRITF